MKIKLGLCQMKVTADKEQNLKNAAQCVGSVADADIIILPEIWNSPYDNRCFRRYGETETGDSCNMLSRLAAQYGAYIVGGSIPELDGERVHNTSFVFDRQGKIIAKHRKMHLFDINVVGGQSFCESAVLTAGDKVTVFDTEYGKIGLCICYDYRFPELARLMTLQGAGIIIVPAAFNMTTGPAHWEIMFRSRSLDNQVFSVGVAPARSEEEGYVSYANSIVTDPWGGVCAQLGTSQECKIVEIDTARIEAVRNQLPLLRHRRTALYDVIQL